MGVSRCSLVRFDRTVILGSSPHCPLLTPSSNGAETNSCQVGSIQDISTTAFPGDIMAKKLEIIISLDNQYERHSLGEALDDIGFVIHYCTEIANAKMMLQYRSFQIAIVIFDADRPTLQFLDSVLEFLSMRGYQGEMQFWGLSNKHSDFDLESELQLRGAQFCAKGRPGEMLRKARAVEKCHETFSTPEFQLTHIVGEGAWHGRCVAGELISELAVRRSAILPLTVSLSQAPLVFADATLRYSSEDHPQPVATILRYMALDPLYMSCLEEASMNKRNFITNFYRIKEDGLRPLWGAETDEYVRSENLPGGEKAFFFRGKVQVVHKFKDRLFKKTHRD